MHPLPSQRTVLLRSISSLMVFALPFTFFSPTARGGLVTFTDRASFDAIASGQASIVDFDSSPLGNVPSGGAIGGITFSYDFGGVSLSITDVFPTASGTNFLGTNDGDLLQDGDNLSMNFSASTGFGLYIISADSLMNGDFQLAVASASASLDSSAVQETLSDGSSVWFLGIKSDDASTFSSASLTTHGGGGAFLYNIDDIVSTAPVSIAAVPEPSSLALFLGFVGATGCLGLRNRFRSRLTME